MTPEETRLREIIRSVVDESLSGWCVEQTIKRLNDDMLSGGSVRDNMRNKMIKTFSDNARMELGIRSIANQMVEQKAIQDIAECYRRFKKGVNK